MSGLIEILHGVSSKLADIEDESQIYQILNDGIKQILPDAYFIITKLQPDDMNFRIIHSFGFDKYFTAIKTLIGKDPFQMDFPFSDLSEQKQKLFESRKLYHASGGIYEITNGRVNKTICKTIKKFLGISEVYALSFCVGEKYFGGSVLFIPKSNLEAGKLNMESTLTIENLAAQASFAINKLRDFEALTKKENELKIANKELKKSVSLLTATLESTADGILVVDNNGKFASYNNKFKELWQVPDSAISKHDNDEGPLMPIALNQLSDPDSFLAKVKELYLSEDTSFDVLHFKDGRIYERYSQAQILDGKSVGRVWSFRDVTEHKKAELALKESEKKRRDWIENSPACTKVIDLNLNLQYMSHAGIVGLKIDDISEYYGKPFPFSFYPESLKNTITKNLKKAIETGEKTVYEAPLIDLEGNKVWFDTTIKPIKNNKGQVEYLLVISVDTTKQNESKEKLKESEDNYRSIVENNHDAIYIYKDNRFQFFNSKVSSLSGYSQTELKSMKIWDLIYPEDLKVIEEYAKIRKEERNAPSFYSARVVCKNGDIRNCDFAVKQISYNNEYAVLGAVRDNTRRKIAEHALIESEVKYRTLVDEVKEGFYISDLQGVFTFANRALSQILGIDKPDEIIGRKFTEFLSPKKVDKLFKHYQAALASGIDSQMIFTEIIRQDGTSRFIEIKPLVIFENGKTIGSRGIIHDITERKQAEDKLLNAEEKYRIITQASLDIIFIIDKTGKIIFSNESMKPTLGYQSNEFLGKSFTHFVPKKEIPKYFKVLTDVFKHKEVRDFYTQIYHKEGHLIDVEINGKLIRHEGKVAAQGTIRDISQRKLAEETLKKSEEQHRFLFENTPNGVLYLNAKGEIVHANKAAEQILAFSFNQMQKRKTDDIGWKATHEDGTDYLDEEFPAMITLKTGQAIKNAKMCIYNPLNNSDKIININSLPKFRNNETRPYQVVTTFEDITIQKKAEQLLRESNATKDKFFSIIAHDLRSPFNHILGFSELLIENVNEFDIAQSEKYLGIINSAAKDTLVLLDNLLNWARSQTGKICFKPEKVILASIVHEIFELSNSRAKSKNIILNFIEPGEIVVFADPDMMKTILRNLISNAIKFTHPNGKIEVTALQDDNFIAIAVSDNGVGMKDETRKKLFDISTNITTRGTANEKGSGLGLILCKEFVEKHGGKIWVESQCGIGSQFYFTLPKIK